MSALAQLGNIPGQADFIIQATTSQDEHDAIAFQQSVQIMANLNKSTPVVRITRLNGLTVCQTKDGTVVVPIQWDYAVWTSMTEQFIAALKNRKFTHSGHRLHSYPDRCRLPNDSSSPGRARHQRHHQSASRPTAIRHSSLRILST